MASILFKIAKTLDNENIHFTLERTRPDTINAALVGQRLEIDVFDDDHIEVACFHGNEDVEGDFEFFEKLLSDYKATGS